MFTERLIALRKSKKVTQRCIASALGLSERHYQGIEYGATKPGFDNLIALADYFNVSLDYLVGRSDDPTRR